MKGDGEFGALFALPYSQESLCSRGGVGGSGWGLRMVVDGTEEVWKKTKTETETPDLRFCLSVFGPASSGLFSDARVVGVC